MNRTADVLIIGAGPAGASAAIALSRSGFRVLLVDRSEFPRDKVCGDALIPDALTTLDRLGLRTRVVTLARRLSGVRIYAPNQQRVTIRGECACLPRQVFDEQLRQAAIEAGATFIPGLRVERPLRDERGSVAGAAFSEAASAADSPAAGSIELRAPLTLLATGGAAEPLKRFDVCERSTASATAARVYVETDAAYAASHEHLVISYDRTICPGYGWIFPGPGGIFNLGIGYFYDARHAPPERNVRQLLDRFVASFPPARDLLRHGRVRGVLKGAPLRTRLAGARLSSPGLLVIGEAAGTTYSFSGEGIGKAMESGLVASEVLAVTRDPVAAAERYAETMRARYATRFAAYGHAQDWLTHPHLANLLAWRAAKGGYVHRQLEGLFQETSDPSELFSPLGLLKAIVR